MTEELDDEDIILENSPLNQYLNTIDFGNSYVEEKVINQKHVEESKFYKLKIYINNHISGFHHCLKRKLLAGQIHLILNCARQINILNEIDVVNLDYLINTRFIQWKSVLINKEDTESISVVAKWVFFLSLTYLLLSTVFGKLAIVLVITFVSLLYILVLSLYGILIRWIMLTFFQRLVVVSTQSRQTILLLQELLSLNQGYSRLVHLQDSSNFDCSKSFNSEFLESFSAQIFDILFEISHVMEKCNEDLFEHAAKHIFIVREVPWFQDDQGLVGNVKSLIGEPNYRQPVTQLKHLHNLIQSQFSDFIKMVVLYIYSFRNLPSTTLLLHVTWTLHDITAALHQLTKCGDILHIKTKSNLSRASEESQKQTSPRTVSMINLIRSLELHLFEISEFTSRFSLGLLKNRDANETSLIGWLGSQSQMIDKGRAHIDAIQACWDEFHTEFNESLHKATHTETVPEKVPSSLREPVEKEPVLIDSYPEIVDEIIEGLPDDPNDTTEADYRIHLEDPFEERCKSHARALLNELQSVIDVRAQDWKKREEQALKRRAAEGKFVFEKDDRLDLSKATNDELCRVKYRPRAELPESCVENVEFDLDFRRNLATMILQQRKTMLTDPRAISDSEECFGD